MYFGVSKISNLMGDQRHIVMCLGTCPYMMILEYRTYFNVGRSKSVGKSGLSEFCNWAVVFYIIGIKNNFLNNLPVTWDGLPGLFLDHFVEGSIFFFSQPVADLPTQPLVGLWNPRTPLPTIVEK
ncbi:uncharacterized protein LACBIDRAFT_321718 [Laccaria bicolor S238N-H82]|uniref:Predicted protein n=1 Tax=Laccaria bicolor (strain S238N-H82 / ATCC MYA-4686) TaxID=486041 RepID=B0CTX0_LACBS|nr:uncharacterized protein LACBIDRAFT_321718 [Laccaria bicolor S238N-H82]EDR14573.1 predicted protein [Laccaria bicolor S238N-H82]|eukprot:XP_001875132.1 predicted protein [Laccaria bicolor S238N-H82]